jgi:nucleotide-binding universal stress UspA family protein
MSEAFDPLQRIMACVDGSEAGYRAADFAIALCKGLGSKVYFAYVVGASTSEPNYKISADMVGSFEVLGTEVLSKCAAKAQKSQVIFEILQLEGEPADEILRSAEQNECDCIVMGRKGMSRLEKMLLGSVSEKVIRLSKLPVTIVK